MKKITAIILLTCLSYTVIGYHLAFQLFIVEAKTEMKQNIHSLAYERFYEDLVFQKNEQAKLNWLGDDEFQWNGGLYDVISKTRKGDDMVIRCVEDKKEDGLVRQYIRTGRSGNAEGQPSMSLLKLINAYFLSSSRISAVSIAAENIKTYQPHSFVLPDRCLPIIVPPPKVC